MNPIPLKIDPCLPKWKSTNNMSNHNTSNVSSSNYQVSEKQQQVHRLQSINANSNKKEDTEVETTTGTNLQQGLSAENTTDEQNSFRCNVQNQCLQSKILTPVKTMDKLRTPKPRIVSTVLVLELVGPLF